MPSPGAAPAPGAPPPPPSRPQTRQQGVSPLRAFNRGCVCRATTSSLHLPGFHASEKRECPDNGDTVRQTSACLETVVQKWPSRHLHRCQLMRCDPPDVRMSDSPARRACDGLSGIEAGAVPAVEGNAAAGKPSDRLLRAQLVPGLEPLTLPGRTIRYLQGGSGIRFRGEFYEHSRRCPEVHSVGATQGPRTDERSKASTDTRICFDNQRFRWCAYRTHSALLKY